MDRTLVEAIKNYRSSIVVSRGKVHWLENLPGYVVIIEDVIKGLILYNIEGNDCEIVTLNSDIEGQGIGTALIDLVIVKARDHACKRVWLITSNDNLKAIRYYQRRGFDIKAVHQNAITEARRIKPLIPLAGMDGIPVKHEIEFEFPLENNGCNR
ncbi:GNAT family N-acetyltransferase [Paenibacillus mendelii]|uniref:GNAT family N-acetyltransferase n=1 Tax=Paenibacillus mendelii TaxID=206163 RepID=A0ABV6J7A2_9BACL